MRTDQVRGGESARQGRSAASARRASPSAHPVGAEVVCISVPRPLGRARPRRAACSRRAPPAALALDRRRRRAPAATAAAPARRSPRTCARPAIATWFGPGFYGQKTACGQTLTPAVVGVANRTLPCGTLVRVTYTGHALTVPVLDRGPYAHGADWDLTAGAARALGVSDTVRIRTRVVGTAPNTPTLGAPLAGRTGTPPAAAAGERRRRHRRRLSAACPALRSRAARPAGRRRALRARGVEVEVGLGGERGGLAPSSGQTATPTRHRPRPPGRLRRPAASSGARAERLGAGADPQPGAHAASSARRARASACSPRQSGRSALARSSPRAGSALGVVLRRRVGLEQLDQQHRERPPVALEGLELGADRADPRRRAPAAARVARGDRGGATHRRRGADALGGSASAARPAARSRRCAAAPRSSTITIRSRRAAPGGRGAAGRRRLRELRRLAGAAPRARRARAARSSAQHAAMPSPISSSRRAARVSERARGEASTAASQSTLRSASTARASSPGAAGAGERGERAPAPVRRPRRRRTPPRPRARASITRRRPRSRASVEVDARRSRSGRGRSISAIAQRFASSPACEASSSSGGSRRRARRSLLLASRDRTSAVEYQHRWTRRPPGCARIACMPRGRRGADMTGVWIAVGALVALAALAGALWLLLRKAPATRAAGDDRRNLATRPRSTPETGAVRSVQRAEVLIEREALEEIWTPMHLERLARTYWRFLTRVTLGLIRVRYSERGRAVVLLTEPLRLLTFEAPEYEMDAHARARALADRARPARRAPRPRRRRLPADRGAAAARRRPARERAPRRGRGRRTSIRRSPRASACACTTRRSRAST